MYCVKNYNLSQLYSSEFYFLIGQYENWSFFYARGIFNHDYDSYFMSYNLRHIQSYLNVKNCFFLSKIERDQNFENKIWRNRKISKFRKNRKIRINRKIQNIEKIENRKIQKIEKFQKKKLPCSLSLLSEIPIAPTRRPAVKTFVASSPAGVKTFSLNAESDFKNTDSDVVWAFEGSESESDESYWLKILVLNFWCL